ncbi:MAG: GIY-YIG nuclease family protein [Planctomycetes bacterium]|nr:GIY-YIG nuclease family protein [Planctomycetota bacterium]
MLKLVDLIKLAGVQLHDFKIHCAIGEGNPLDAFFDGTWKLWQETQNQKNFECSQILSLIYLGPSQWLFAGIYEVLGVKVGRPDRPSGFTYDTREVGGLEHLTGRAIVAFDKKFRASYLRGDKWADSLLVSSIREERMTIGEFPGFNSVLLSFQQIRTVVRESHASWKAALGNVSGVYVITETTTGKQYVGSAYGGVGIWQRWSSYAKNGHGGNVELRALLDAKGADHAQKLQFALLEVCDINSSDDYIIGRECHWKAALRTIGFGLNRN